eukprot:14932827-Alexandrium_andersonii.AAC.1
MDPEAPRCGGPPLLAAAPGPRLLEAARCGHAGRNYWAHPGGPGRIAQLTSQITHQYQTFGLAAG